MVSDPHGTRSAGAVFGASLAGEAHGCWCFDLDRYEVSWDLAGIIWQEMRPWPLLYSFILEMARQMAIYEVAWHANL